MMEKSIPKLADRSLCTGCGVCSYVCPRRCINMCENEIGCFYPEVDSSICIGCRKCEHSCPIIDPIHKQQPIKAYAAWSTNEEERLSSASGGIAAELYHYALRNHYKIGGAVQTGDFSVKICIGSDPVFARKLKNSKYVFSEMFQAYQDIDNALKNDDTVLIIALPCQTAAIRKVFGLHPKAGNLLLVDVVCHGVTPTRYLIQHLETIQCETNQTIASMSFRDPQLHTSKFYLTCYNNDGERIYAKRTADGDAYQYGYHRAVSYRENCYHCYFACPERTGDISLCDYTGLGTVAPCSYDKENVSCVLVNSEKGDAIISSLISAEKIVSELRPVHEPLDANGQLKRPVSKSKDRMTFEKRILTYRGDFEKAIGPIVKKGIKKKQLKDFLRRIIDHRWH